MASGLLGACSAPEPPASASTSWAVEAAFTNDPAPEPSPLPVLDPPSRQQRQIEGMGTKELAGWIVPEEAERIARAELYPPRWGLLTYGLLWEAPRAAGPAGVCEVSGRGVSFRVENENSLSQQQRLDPPLTPFQTVPERRFRVFGSTRSGERNGPLDCTGDQPYRGWSTAPSAQAIHLAASLMEQAQLRARAPGALPFKLGCTPMSLGDPATPEVKHPCTDPRVFLQRFMPGLIDRVRSTACEGDFSSQSEGPCIAIRYDDPDTPGTHSFYMVRVAGERRPRSIEIVQGMMPPH